MSITCFDDLVNVAKEQPDPQRLLFVFTTVEEPEEMNARNRQAYEQGVGGNLIPMACVDKTVDELAGGFAQLSKEAYAVVPDWTLVFAAAIGGSQGHAPSSEEAQSFLDQMIEMIKVGRVAGLNAFNRDGEAMLLHAMTEYEAVESSLLSKPPQ